MAPWAPAFRMDLTRELPGTNKLCRGFQTPLEESVSNRKISVMFALFLKLMDKHMYRNLKHFCNDPRSSAFLESLVGGRWGTVLQVGTRGLRGPRCPWGTLPGSSLGDSRDASDLPQRYSF